MTAVDQFSLDTVENREAFIDNAEFKDCLDVGRSLVAKKPLKPGDTVLVERPWIRYPLQPDCRSSLSPYFSTLVWDRLKQAVMTEEQKLFGEPLAAEDSDHAELDDSKMASAYCPGIPAAFMAYLAIRPPTTSHVRLSKEYQAADLAFFYSPEEIVEHPTVKLVQRVAQSITETLPQLFGHIKAADLARFTLQIYGNAHTVAFQHQRKAPTHPQKRWRRDKYRTKWGEPSPGWPDDKDKNRPMIALMSWGSKFAHACAPNMFLQYEPQHNVMVFTAVRDIAQGEVLTFSYLPEDDLSKSGLICGTTVMRQAKLRQFKFFDCACARCNDWDWSRGMDCTVCGSDRMYCKEATWVCQVCGHSATDDTMNQFLREREQHVQDKVVAIAPKVFGINPLESDMMGGLEPYLTSLLDADGPASVPRQHWTFGYIHALLATYHLKLFAQSFGQGLAAQLGMVATGLQEAEVYLRRLHEMIWTHGNPMPAFFAGWRLLAIVIDVVMESTEKRSYVPVTPQNNDVDDADSEEETTKTTTGRAGFELVPLPADYQAPVRSIAALISTHWLPLLKAIFAQRPTTVMDVLVPRIQSFLDRVALTPASFSSSK